MLDLLSRQLMVRAHSCLFRASSRIRGIGVMLSQSTRTLHSLSQFGYIANFGSKH